MPFPPKSDDYRSTGEVSADEPRFTKKKAGGKRGFTKRKKTGKVAPAQKSLMQSGSSRSFSGGRR